MCIRDRSNSETASRPTREVYSAMSSCHCSHRSSPASPVSPIGFGSGSLRPHLKSACPDIFEVDALMNEATFTAIGHGQRSHPRTHCRPSTTTMTPASPAGTGLRTTNAHTAISTSVARFTVRPYLVRSPDPSGDCRLRGNAVGHLAAQIAKQSGGGGKVGGSAADRVSHCLLYTSDA